MSKTHALQVESSRHALSCSDITRDPDFKARGLQVESSRQALSFADIIDAVILSTVTLISKHARCRWYAVDTRALSFSNFNRDPDLNRDPGFKARALHLESQSTSSIIR